MKIINSTQPLFFDIAKNSEKLQQKLLIQYNISKSYIRDITLNYKEKEVFLLDNFNRFDLLQKPLNWSRYKSTIGVSLNTQKSLYKHKRYSKFHFATLNNYLPYRGRIVDSFVLIYSLLHKYHPSNEDLNPQSKMNYRVLRAAVKNVKLLHKLTPKEGGFICYGLGLIGYLPKTQLVLRVKKLLNVPAFLQKKYIKRIYHNYLLADAITLNIEHWLRIKSKLIFTVPTVFRFYFQMLTPAVVNPIYKNYRKRYKVNFFKNRLFVLFLIKPLPRKKWQVETDETEKKLMLEHALQVEKTRKALARERNNSTFLE